MWFPTSPHAKALLSLGEQPVAPVGNRITNLRDVSYAIRYARNSLLFRELRAVRCKLYPQILLKSRSLTRRARCSPERL